jgi:hypothetical protein
MTVNALFRWTSPRHKWDETPQVVERHTKRKLREDALDEAYAIVDARDRSICWVTGRHTHPSAVSPETRREHHHLKGRRVEPTWVTKPERIITVSAAAHSLITAGWIIVEGCDTRKPLFFHWRADLKPSQKVLVIHRKRIRPEPR